MTREEAIEQLQNCKDLIKQDGQDYLDERDFPLLDMAIEALSKPNYETDTEVRLAVTNRKKEKVILWDAFGEVEYCPHGDMYCPNCGVRLVPENEYLEPKQTHGRLIDADALSKKLCGTTLFVKDGEVFQRMINDAPTVQAEAVQGWIPCSERLPEIACRCLVTLSNNIIAVGTLHSEGEYEDDFGYSVHWGQRWHLEPASIMIAYHEDSVIAWMPLPKPYKGGDDK